MSSTLHARSLKCLHPNLSAVVQHERTCSRITWVCLCNTQGLSAYCRLAQLVRCSHTDACRVPALSLQPQPEASGADSDDDWSMGAKKGKKGKAAAAGKGKGGKAGGGGSSSAAAGKQQQKGGPDVNSVLTVGVLAQEMLKLYPDMEDAGELAVCTMLFMMLTTGVTQRLHAE